MIAIIDYGMGNIHSVRKALESLGARTVVTNDPAELAQADKAILPGVGAFDDAMTELDARGLSAAIKDFVSGQGRSLLGICLGMQLLFERSEEGNLPGLGLIAGEVKRFPASTGLKVPHMGWNLIRVARKDCPLLQDIGNEAYVYFCHSYFPSPGDRETSAALTEYGEPFTSVVWRERIFGAQFHPEKSQGVGLKILENFVKM